MALCADDEQVGFSSLGKLAELHARVAAQQTSGHAQAGGAKRVGPIGLELCASPRESRPAIDLDAGEFPDLDARHDQRGNDFRVESGAVLYNPPQCVMRAWGTVKSENNLHDSAFRSPRRCADGVASSVCGLPFIDDQYREIGVVDEIVFDRSFHQTAEPASVV
jgi:hypothetical protein